MRKPYETDLLNSVFIYLSYVCCSMEGEEKIRLCQEAAAILGMACYIQGAMATMMFLAYEFHEDFTEGVLTNANCGGKKCSHNLCTDRLI